MTMYNITFEKLYKKLLDNKYKNKKLTSLHKEMCRDIFNEYRNTLLDIVQNQIILENEFYKTLKNKLFNKKERTESLTRSTVFVWFRAFILNCASKINRYKNEIKN